MVYREKTFAGAGQFASTVPCRRIINRYVIGHRLGSGGQAKVRLGVDIYTGKPVALKIITNKLSEEAVKQINVEVTALRQLRHVKNVVRLLNVDQQALYPKKDGTLVECVLLVLEYAPGGELFSLIEKHGPMPEWLALAHFRQLVESLDTFHRLGIYHRDLKPENVLVCEDDVLKISDFGLASLPSLEYQGIIDGARYRRCAQGSSRLLRSQTGTLNYMSPEILAGYPYLGAPADLWSLGCLLFIMVAGFPPMEVADETDWWFRQLRAGNVEAFWKGHEQHVRFTPPLKALLTGLLEPDPFKRWNIQDVLNSRFVHGGKVSWTLVQQEMLKRRVVASLDYEPAIESEEGYDYRERDASHIEEPFRCLPLIGDQDQCLEDSCSHLFDLEVSFPVEESSNLFLCDEASTKITSEANGIEAAFTRKRVHLASLFAEELISSAIVGETK